MQNESMVHILALLNSRLWRISPISSGCFLHSSSSRLSILERISAAAAFVNVTIKSLSALTGDTLSVSFLITLSVSTAVLPEPAAAETSTLPAVSIAACCSLVALNAICGLLPHKL